MAKKNKEYKIRTFADLNAIVTKDNVDIIFGNFYGSMRQFLAVKDKHPDISFIGFNWIDDGKMDIVGHTISVEVDGKMVEKKFTYDKKKTLKKK